MAAAASRGKKKKQLLPGSLQERLINGAHKGLGVAALGCAVVAWACLMSWSVSDPSLSRAVDGPVLNLGGKPGAIFSDILFQSFGLASIIVMLPVAVLGMHLIMANPVTHFRLRVLSWPLSIALLSTTLSLLPVAGSWPLPQSYGGAVGDTFVKVFQLQTFTGGTLWLPLFFFILLSALSIYALSFTTALRIKDAKVLFNIANREELKAALKSPINRASFWFHSRRAKGAFRPESNNERKWWRNANLDTPALMTNGPKAATRGFEIHPPQSPMARPIRPNGEAAVINTALPNSSLPPSQLPPMSAIPEYGAVTGAPSLKAAFDAPFGTGDNSRLNGHGTGPEFLLPPIECLTPTANNETLAFAHEELSEMALMLENVLLDFGIKGSILNVRPGPVVTLFEFEPARGTKTSRIIGLSDDIARSMSAISARIAVIPGRSVIGIELPNPTRETVFLRELVEQPVFLHSEETLPLILGKSIGGEPIIQDLATMPHLLIAGTTGSGKSVGINTMLLSLLYRLTPKECRLILIDPKMLELSIYDGIPHLLTPVVTEPLKALSALKWAVREMEDRYRQMSKLGVRNIEGFNERVNAALKQDEPLKRTVQTGFDQQTGRAIFEEETMTFEPLPMIVIVIDEMADLMMVAGKEIEIAVQRLAQMARAAGIHVIMATQRPSVDVITGTIKANFPTRISFQVTSKIDSRTILGKEGAEQLLGAGDMLYMPGGSRVERVHGAFVNDDEVARVAEFLRAQGVPEYLDTIILDEEHSPGESPAGQNGQPDIYTEAVEIVLRDQKATISYLQRRLSIGYNRAATLIERMENEGVIGPANRAGKREILMDHSEY